MSGSGKQGRNSRETPSDDLLESRPCRDIYKDLIGLTSQVQMMSDSLAACKQMSKHRPLKKMYSRAKGISNPATTASALPFERTTQDDHPKDDENCVIVSYVLEEQQHRRKSGTYNESGIRESRSSVSEDQEEIRKTTSNVQTHQARVLDTRRMLDVIQKELKILLEIAPSVALMVTALSDALLHFKGCGRCCQKISASLPWILSRIQNLIIYVTTKKQSSYSWPDNHNYLPATTSGDSSTLQNTPHITPQNTPKNTFRNTLLGSSHKIDPLCLSEDAPGVQLVLHVKPLKTKKRFFHQLKNSRVSSWKPLPGFPVVHLRKPESVPVVQVLVPSKGPRVVVEEKREVSEVRQTEYSFRAVFRHPLGLLSTLLVTISTERVQEEFVKSEGSDGKQGEGSNEKKTVSSRNLLDNVPQIVWEFLQEAEEEKMRDERMHELESGVKELKAGMLEVEKNQMALSKMLLKKGVYSQPLIRLTDPKMLEKESMVVRLAEEVQSGRSMQAPMEDVQTEVNEMQQKCGLKNSMLLIVLNGLRSNIPKEWWENMLDDVLNESKPIEEFDIEKMSELLEQASGFPGNEEKEWRDEEQPVEVEEQETEEEPKMKGNMGADPEKSSDCHGMTANPKDVASIPDIHFTETFLTFPVSNRPDNINSTIKKLENQVSTLNVENERLWHEVHELRNLLNTSMKNCKRDSLPDSDHQSTSSSSSAKSSGKSINLTIQIVDKDFQRVKNRHRLDLIDQSQTPTTSHSSSSSFTPPKHNPALGASSPNYTARPLLRHSENDLNYLEDTSLSPPHLRADHRLSSVLRERTSGHQLVVAPRPSAHELSLRPLSWVQSRYPMLDGYRGGPSRCLRERPSMMTVAESLGSGLLGSMGTSRELGTIPENESGASWTPLEGIGQAIQQLRSRVRSIHKDVTVLKSKNDRIDKLLDRLMEDALVNSQSFEEMELDFQRLKDQLG